MVTKFRWNEFLLDKSMMSDGKNVLMETLRGRENFPSVIESKMNHTNGDNAAHFQTDAGSHLFQTRWPPVKE